MELEFDSRIAAVIIAVVLIVAVLAFATVAPMGVWKATETESVGVESWWAVTTKYADGSSETVDEPKGAEKALAFFAPALKVLSPGTDREISEVGFALNVRFSEPVYLTDAAVALSAVGDRAGARQVLPHVGIEIPQKGFLSSEFTSSRAIIKASEIENLFSSEFSTYDAQLIIDGVVTMMAETQQGVKGSISVNIGEVVYPFTVKAIEVTVSPITSTGEASGGGTSVAGAITTTAATGTQPPNINDLDTSNMEVGYCYSQDPVTGQETAMPGGTYYDSTTHEAVYVSDAVGNAVTYSDLTSGNVAAVPDPTSPTGWVYVYT